MPQLFSRCQGRPESKPFSVRLYLDKKQDSEVLFMAFEQVDDVYSSGVRIKVIGVGGGGGNAVNRMISTNIRGVPISLAHPLSFVFSCLFIVLII